MSGQCFHCHEPLPTPCLNAEVAGEEQAFCCQGCIAVAQLVADCGLDNYYRFRAQPAPRPEDTLDWRVYDRVQMLDKVSRPASQCSDPAEREILLHFDGVRCAACSWLLQQLAQRTPGVISLEVNPATARGRVVWNQDQLPLSQLLSIIASWGYRPTPEQGRDVIAARQRESKQALMRLAVAGIGMMQVMMYAVGLYLGEYQGMSPEMRDGLRWFSLLLSIPVLWYAGWPILRNAWHGLRARRAVMDQPVALALLLAWSLSVINTLGPVLAYLGITAYTTSTQAGDVYFEAVTMFVFFLTLARFVEMRARHRSAATAERFAGVALVIARRLNASGEVEDVDADELVGGDHVQLSSGDVVPSDATLRQGGVAVDESLLTGESEPIQYQAGACLLAGSRVIAGDAIAEISCAAQESSLGRLRQMLAQAESQRPQWSATADRLAAYFIVSVLVLALAVGIYWSLHDSERALAIVLSVLVITCPCALSLAAPAALAAATGNLARRGIFIGGAEALGRLARLDSLLLDKTGTLTQGRYARVASHQLSDLPAEQALVLAATMLHGSRHPVSSAFQDLPHADATVSERHEQMGEGIEAEVNGQTLRLGRPEFAAPDSDWPTILAPFESSLSASQQYSYLVLANQDGPVALFLLSDQLRQGAPAAIKALHSLKLPMALISGDRRHVVEAMAKQLSINDWRGEMRPEEKMAYAHECQTQSQLVAMVGDGVNDAPVLATADVSIALAHGAAIPKTQADVVLTGSDLNQLPDLIASARQTEHVIRQNLGWALAYNLCAVPAAAMGLVVPWVAALGMSLSSLVVVLNAVRAGRRQDYRYADGVTPMSGHASIAQQSTRPPSAVVGG